MKLIAIALLALAIFVAVWMFVVVPAEKRHHDRKLASIQKRIEKRQEASENEKKYAPPQSRDDE